MKICKFNIHVMGYLMDGNSCKMVDLYLFYKLDVIVNH